MNLKKIYLLMLPMILSLGLVACSDDDDDILDPDLFPTGSIAVDDTEMLNDNTITINSVTMSDAGWVVLHRDNGDSPMVPEIISVPEPVGVGTTSDIMIELADGEEVTDGETLWVMLHTDDGIIETYEFDGTSGLDAPIMDIDDNIVTESFTVEVENMPVSILTAMDQDLMNNVVIVESINLEQDGYVVVHASNEAGDGPMVPEIISEPVYLEAGMYNNVEVPLTSSANVEAGDTLWIMLHDDTGEEEVYEFDGENGLDLPLMDGDNIIMTSIMINDVVNMNMVAANDQDLVNGVVTVESITLEEDGYVVVHASNDDNDGPMVPEIISEPVYLEAGTYRNVGVPLTDDADVEAGDVLWVMLHNDSGEEEVYEFDGENGLDLPLMDGDNIIMTSITINDVTEAAMSGSITVSDQPVENNTITVENVSLDRDGWVVVHASNEAGDGPMVPEIISEPVYLEDMENADVTITFKDDANVSSGDVVWVMLHNDTGVEGVYEFDGMNGLDLPITDDGGVVVTPITIQ